MEKVKINLKEYLNILKMENKVKSFKFLTDEEMDEIYEDVISDSKKSVEYGMMTGYLEPDEYHTNLTFQEWIAPGKAKNIAINKRIANISKYSKIMIKIGRTLNLTSNTYLNVLKSINNVYMITKYNDVVIAIGRIRNYVEHEDDKELAKGVDALIKISDTSKVDVIKTGNMIDLFLNDVIKTLYDTEKLNLEKEEKEFNDANDFLGIDII